MSNTCYICLENINNPLFFICGHSFCKICINEWLKRSNTCPTCRRELIKESFKPSTKEELQQAVDEWCNNNNIAINKYGNINEWNTSLITNMDNLFYEKDKFNDPIGNWDVSNVTTMKDMFFKAVKFNQSLDSWDVRNVRSMQSMFSHTKYFNQPLESWDVSNVTSMEYMFYEATNFNQSLILWNVNDLTNIEGIFEGAESFNYSVSFLSFKPNNKECLEECLEEAIEF